MTTTTRPITILDEFEQERVRGFGVAKPMMATVRPRKSATAHRRYPKFARATSPRP